MPVRPKNTEVSQKRKEEKSKERDQRFEREYQRRQEELDNKLKHQQQKHEFKSVIEKLKFETYTKRLVGIIVGVGLVDLQLSYVLAFLDKVEIAESLSIQVCTTILGTALMYLIRAYFDTRAEKKEQKEMTKAMDDKILDTVRDRFYDADMDIPSDIEKFNPFKSEDEESSEESADDPVVTDYIPSKEERESTSDLDGTESETEEEFG